ncbi:MAG: methyltransferase domain-containing protein [Dehalococcoidia bacterium]|nr:methyltransferase domain-containing protein [Dehalococcoidia bacterium]
MLDPASWTTLRRRARKLPGWLRSWAAHQRGRAKQRFDSLPQRIANFREGGIPIPPARLIYSATRMESVEWFLASGQAARESIRETAAGVGIEIERLEAVLDFGCGPGRVMRHWQGLRGPALFGSDYNRSSVEWCRRNLAFAEFRVNALGGPLAFDSEAFDLVYGLSVFTHLTEERQRYWMDELTRVVRPGGHLLITTHGKRHASELPGNEWDRFAAGELVVVRGDREGRNECAAFHPESYVRANLARGLEVARFEAEGARGNPWQDLYLLRKP